MFKILVVENDAKLAQFIELELKYEGYLVRICDQGKNVFSTVEKNEPDLILLDLVLPDASGLDIARQLRIKQVKTPIILLTTNDEISDRVASLDAGIDDYLLKNFNSEELFSRIKVYLHHNQEQDPDLLQFLDLRLNKRNKQVHRGDRLVELTSTEYELLEYLISHPHQVLTREQILNKVWGYDFMGDSNIIEVYIRYLRLKLEANQESRLIKTVRGVGYVLKE